MRSLFLFVFMFAMLCSASRGIASSEIKALSDQVGSTYRYGPEFEMSAAHLVNIISYFEAEDMIVDPDLPELEMARLMIARVDDFALRRDIPADIYKLLSHFEWKLESHNVIEFIFPQDRAITNLYEYYLITQSFIQIAGLSGQLNHPFEPNDNVAYHMHVSRQDGSPMPISSVMAMLDYKAMVVLSKDLSNNFKSRGLQILNAGLASSICLPTNLRLQNHIEDKLQIMPPTQQLAWVIENLEADDASVLRMLYDEIFTKHFNLWTFLAMLPEVNKVYEEGPNENLIRVPSLGASLIFRMLKGTSYPTLVLEKLKHHFVIALRDGHIDAEKLAIFYEAAVEEKQVNLFSLILEHAFKVLGDAFPREFLTGSGLVARTLPQVTFDLLLQHPLYTSGDQFEVLESRKNCSSMIAPKAGSPLKQPGLSG